MSETSIEWTATVNPDGSVTPGKTWNPVTGCSKVSPGCAKCYIERTPAFRINHRKFVDGVIPMQLHADRLDQPLHWRKPRRVFVNSLSDLFHKDVPDAFIDRVFAVMAWTPWHTYQILTKRAERMRAYFAEPWHQRVTRVYREMREATPRRELIAVPDQLQRQQGWAFGSLTCGEHARRFLPNVWLGVSVENQHFADERIPLLLQTPGAVRFISAEPLLGAVSLKRFMPKPMFHCPECSIEKMRDRCDKCGTFDNAATNQIGGLDWVIVGGESGHGARPFDVAWARSIVAQCKASGVPVFVKQLGANAFEDIDKVDVTEHAVFGPEVTHYTEPRDLTLHSKKGGDPSEWPADLRVREFPRGGR